MYLDPPYALTEAGCVNEEEIDKITMYYYIEGDRLISLSWGAFAPDFKGFMGSLHLSLKCSEDEEGYFVYKDTDLINNLRGRLINNKELYFLFDVTSEWEVYYLHKASQQKFLYDSGKTTYEFDWTIPYEDMAVSKSNIYTFFLVFSRNY